VNQKNTLYYRRDRLIANRYGALVLIVSLKSMSALPDLPVGYTCRISERIEEEKLPKIDSLGSQPCAGDVWLPAECVSNKIDAAQPRGDVPCICKGPLGIDRAAHWNGLPDTATPS
jgi:hypothetical protein